MPTLAAIPKIEEVIEKPVTSSTQALFWRAMRTAGIKDPIDRMGSLLSYI
jgi:maleate cis-trans isomerase